MRILLIGIGSIAKKHIKAIRQIEARAEIFALRSSMDAEPYEAVQNIYEYDEIKYVAPDFIIISNPTSKHFDTIRRLLPYKIPLFIEKPVFAELGHEDVVKEIMDNRILTYVACDMRFLDCVRYMHEYVHTVGKERTINEIDVYCGSYLPEWRPGTDFRKCYSSIPELGGGVHIDLIHDIDYVYWIFGQPVECRSVFSKKSSLNISAYDYANYCLRYPNFCASIILNYYRRDKKRTMEVLFDDETWTIDMNANTITSNDGVIVYKSEQSGMDCYVSQMKEFMNLVQSGAHSSQNDVDEAYEVLKLCLSQQS